VQPAAGWSVSPSVREQVISAHRLRQLPADVEKVVAHLVHCVDGYPSQRALGPCRVVVHHSPLPIIWAQAGEHIGEQVRRVGQLPRHGCGFLLGVAVMFDSLVSAHWVERWSISMPSGEHPLSLHEQHVAEVARVLEG